MTDQPRVLVRSSDSLDMVLQVLTETCGVLTSVVWLKYHKSLHYLLGWQTEEYREKEREEGNSIVFKYTYKKNPKKHHIMTLNIDPCLVYVLKY